MTLVSLLLGLSLPANVTYETRAARIPVILEQLEDLTKQKLVADAAFTNEVMVISVTDVNPSDLLTKIARASTGTWEKDKDRLILKPDLKRRAEQEKERVALRVKRVQDVLDRCQKELETPYTGEVPGRRPSMTKPEDMAAQRRTPLSRLAMRLLVSIGANRLAEIGPGDRVVFAIDPNPMQAPLPVSAGKAIELFRREWTTRLAATGTPAETQEGSVQLGQTFGRTASDKGFSPQTPFDRVWFSARDITASGFDQRCRVGVEGAGSTLGAELDLYTPPPPFVPREVEKDPTKLIADPATKEVGSLQSMILNVGHEILKPDSKARRLLADPSFEPLSFGSEFYHQFARAKGVDLVSLVNDNSLPWIVGGGVDRTVGEFEVTLRQIASRETEGTWLITAPAQPAEARRSRDDRKMLRALVSDSIDGSTSLDAIAEYVASRPRGNPMGLSGRMSALFDSNLVGMMSTWQEASYRVYGSLDRASRKSGHIRFGMMPKPVRESLQKSVFAANILQRQEDYLRYVEFKMSPFTTTRASSEEITYYLPNGIPDEAILNLDISPFQPTLRPVVPGQRVTYSSDRQIESIAREIFFRENPQFVAPGAPPSQMPEFFLGAKESTVRMTLPLGAYITYFALKDERIVTDIVPFAKLPQEFKDAVQAEVKKLNAQRDAGNPPRRIADPAQSGRQNPPPPKP